MSSTLYYGEIVAIISTRLCRNNNHFERIMHIMDTANDNADDTISTVCADAGMVFDKIEDISGEHFIDWHRALDIYSGKILDHFLSGHKPNTIDLLSMAVTSIQTAL